MNGYTWVGLALCVVAVVLLGLALRWQVRQDDRKAVVAQAVVNEPEGTWTADDDRALAAYARELRQYEQNAWFFRDDAGALSATTALVLGVAIGAVGGVAVLLWWVSA